MTFASAPLLSVSGLRKSYFGVEVLKDVSFKLAPGTALGVIGENGSGKSTTMNIISGLVSPSDGSMAIDGQPYEPKTSRDASRAGVALIHQELNLFENLSIAENLSIQALPRLWRFFPHINRHRMRADAARLLGEVDLDLPVDLPVNRLPQGERQLVEIAKALAGNPRIIIFDEPTTSLTTREAERLFRLVRKLKAKGIGVLYVSHILEDVLGLCEEVAILRDGAMIDILATDATSVPQLASAMIGRPLNTFFPRRETAYRRPASAAALAVHGITQANIARDVSFDIGVGEIVGIAGLMGSGRSEVARMVFGLDAASSGEVKVAGVPVTERSPRASVRAGIAFLTEDRRGDGLMASEGVLTNLELARLVNLVSSPIALIPQEELDRDGAAMAEQVRLRAHDLRSQPVRSLSGGNQQKVVLGKWLLCSPRVLILDEPTRGIDVGAKAEIFSLIRTLADRGTGILMISSELEELFAMCDRLLVMAHGEIVAKFPGPLFERSAVLAAATHAQRDFAL